MATYQQLYELSLNQNLVQRVSIAIAIAAEDIRTEDPATENHDVRVSWARRALQNPDGMARQVLMIALAQNAASPSTAIESASDAVLQTATNNAISLLL